MKAVILAGGLGTRLSEETATRPKPMVEIGGKPILWHIMKMYSHHGVNDFVICCGYKGYVIKEYFANYFLHMSDVTFDMRRQHAWKCTSKRAEPWHVTLVDTGDDTMTGGRLQARGRLRRATKRRSASPTATASATSTSRASIAFHRAHGKAATLTATFPPGRFGALDIEGRPGQQLQGEAQGRRRHDQRRLLRAVAARCSTTSTDDATVWEREPLERLAADGQLMAYEHDGFWQPMDTLRDKHLLEELWALRQGALEDLGMTASRMTPDFWRGKRVLLTGHTGFKGSWLALWLQSLGAEVTGYALAPPTEPSLFDVARVGEGMDIAHRRHPRPRTRCSAPMRDVPARDRHPHGGAAAGAPVLPRAGRDLRHQRDGHGARAGGGAPCRHACAPSSTSPPTSATRTASGSGATARTSPWAATTPTATARAAPSW